VLNCKVRLQALPDSVRLAWKHKRSSLFYCVVSDEKVNIFKLMTPVSGFLHSHYEGGGG
jgi:hypothetical protein